ncbi:MAG: uncharacterized LabA/DUF88 family protein [Oceanospirillaceae bacterium]
MMSIAPIVDQVILLSGDGDFAILLDKIKELHNTQTQVYGVAKLTAKGLIDSCQEFHEISSDDLL